MHNPHYPSPINMKFTNAEWSIWIRLGGTANKCLVFKNRRKNNYSMVTASSAFSIPLYISEYFLLVSAMVLKHQFFNLCTYLIFIHILLESLGSVSLFLNVLK